MATTEKQGLLETKSLSSALPKKPVDQRPKYVQILQQEKTGQSVQSTPSKTSLGTASLTDSPVITEKKKPAAKKFGVQKKPSGVVVNTGKKQYTVYLKKQQVVGLPPEVQHRDHLISSENVVYFSGPKNYLSALYPVTIVVDGNEYNSVEHYYQACKLYILVGEESAAALKEFGTPLEVKKATKDILKTGHVSAAKINEWKDKDSVGVLKHVLFMKFQQHEDLKKQLLETGDKILIQTFLGDTYYAAGANTKYTSVWITRHTNQSLKYPVKLTADNVKYLPLVANGKNVLGWLLMQIREELRAETKA